MVVRLAARENGEGNPVAILHGLFGSARNWTGIAQRLAERHRVIAFDLRNHGASSSSGTMDYAAMAADVRAAMAARGYQRFALIGHSMGGKVAMVLALSVPDAVQRLVVVDIAPVPVPAPFLSVIRALCGLDLGAVARRRDADVALAIAIPDAAQRALLLQSLVFDDGKPRWQLNLTALETALPVIAGFPSFPAGTHYSGPTLFIAGGKSDLLPFTAEPVIRSLFPSATIQQIANAGHWVHTEQPTAFLTLVEPFLAADAD